MGLFNLHFVALCGLLLIASTAAALSPDSHGICYTYTIQGGDTCEKIAAAHGMTVADIEKYNTNTFAWNGCGGEWYQGNFICLSSGEPPMPVALPQAACGPQVPGTTRPSSWSELRGLNPCPSSKCVSTVKNPLQTNKTDNLECTIWGTCSTGPDCTIAESCIDNCEAGATGKASAPTSTKSTKTSSTTTKTAATTLSTAAKKPATETVTHTKATTKTKVVSKTTTVAPPSPTPTWSLTIYDGYTCDPNDYYTLSGSGSIGSKCISIQNGHLSTSSDNDLWCRYYTDGGFNSTSCDGGPVFNVWSWILHNGTCLVYDHDCNDPTSGGQSQSINAYQGCASISASDVGQAIEWRSVRCTVTFDTTPLFG